jgi:hypothetical protein
MIGMAPIWLAQLALGACLMFLVEHVYAVEPVLMRNSLVKPGPVWVWQRVAIEVELLTTTFFAGAPVFQLPTIPQALLMQIEDHPVLGTEQDDDTTYNVQQHELALFMLRPGGYTVPPFTVRFASAPRYGEPPVEHQLTTQAIQVEARMPPGAEHLPSVISTRELRVTQTWQPQPKQAQLGDAFTRTITLTAPDVPGMVFPPLPLAKVDGLAVYPKPPVVQDQVERGAFIGQRTQTVTYVCERPGPVTLPALIIPWWDVEHQQLRQVTLPTLTLEVVAPRRRWSWWVIGVGLVLATSGGYAGTSATHCLGCRNAGKRGTRRARRAVLPSYTRLVGQAIPWWPIMRCSAGWTACTTALARRRWPTTSLPAMPMRTSSSVWQPSRKPCCTGQRTGTVHPSLRRCTGRARNGGRGRLRQVTRSCQT